MRVCLIINSLSGGGAERVVHTLSSHWIRSGVEVDVITLDRGRDYYELDSKVVRHVLRGGWLSRNIFKIVLLPFQSFQLARIIGRRKYDLVISFLVRANIVNSWSRLFGSTHDIILSERSHSDRHYDGGSVAARVMKWLIRVSYPSARSVVALSRGVYDSLVRFGVDPNRIHVIPNPVDIGSIRRLVRARQDLVVRSRPYIVTVGRLISLKDHSMLIRALALVRDEVEVELVIIGDGPLLEILRNEARALGIENAVHFTGWLSNPFFTMARGSVFVLTSKHEGFGNVLLEAMACGLPIISSDTSGPREILANGKYGLLVPVADDQALSVALVRLLTDPILRADYVSRSGRRVSHYDINTVAQSYLNLTSRKANDGD